MLINKMEAAGFAPVIKRRAITQFEMNKFPKALLNNVNEALRAVLIKTVYVRPPEEKDEAGDAEDILF